MKRIGIRVLVLGLQLLSLFLCLAGMASFAQAGLLDSVIGGGLTGLGAAGPIGAIAGIGGGLISGILGNKAAKKAAAVQAAAAAKAANDLNLKTGQVNQDLTDTARTVGDQARTAAGESTARVDQATGSANALLNPYIDTGSKASGLLSTALDSSGHMPTMDEIQIDPGYNFRLQEGEKALQSRAAALGLATGGGTLKAINNYAQQNASQEYANAFARFQQNRQNNISNLLSVSGQGLNAAGTAGSNLLTGGKYGADLNYNSTTYAGDKNYGAVDQAGQNSLNTAGKVADLTTGGAAATAGGIVGGNNALASGIGQAANAVTSAATLSQILKNPNYRRQLPQYDPSKTRTNPNGSLTIGLGGN